MLAGFLQPSCVTPIYWMDDEQVAVRCGLHNGIYYGILGCVLVAMLVAAHAWKRAWGYGITGRPVAQFDSSKFPVKLIAAMVILTVLVVSPILFRESARSQYVGYQDAIEMLMTKYNMTRLEAIESVAGFGSAGLGSATGSVISSAALLASNRPQPQPQQSSNK